MSLRTAKELLEADTQISSEVRGVLWELVGAIEETDENRDMTNAEIRAYMDARAEATGPAR